MTSALLSTFLLTSFHAQYLSFSICFLLGGLIGCLMASFVEMIMMPQMVAALHSFVGLAATLVAWSNFFYRKLNEDEVKTEAID